MLSPATLRPNTYCFCPIGNSPAVNFLEYPPTTGLENDTTVRILSLGCGDPRNLFYTLWANNPCKEKTKWDFICCDNDVAILARNAILYSLIIDNASSSSIWNLFYHFLITDSDIKILKEQLSNIGNFCESLDIWSSSKYGKIIRFMSNDTFLQVQAIWADYLTAVTLEGAAEEKFEADFRLGMRTVNEKSIIDEDHGDRSSGVHFKRGIRLFQPAYKGYWESGVVAGNAKDKRELKKSSGGRVNPLMAISSSHDRKFAVHYATDPLLGFHLVSAFDGEILAEDELENVAILVKMQFQKWCSAFFGHSRADTIKIRLFYGDVLPFCYELQDILHSQVPKMLRLYTTPWRAVPLVLHGPEQSELVSPFDVIDTAGLARHLGILNILPAVIPLLSRKPTAVIFTNFRASEDVKATLSTLLCSDVKTMSLLMGLAPIGSLIGYSTECIGGEAYLHHVIPKDEVYRMRIAWKYMNFGDDISISNPEISHHDLEFRWEDLARFFHRLYLEMFAFFKCENINTPVQPTVIKKRLLTHCGIPYYNHMSFVAILLLIKTRFSPDSASSWDSIIESLQATILADQNLMIRNNALQELDTMFHLLNVYSSMPMAHGPRDLGELLPVYGKVAHPDEKFVGVRPPQADVGLLGKRTIPTIVWVVLTVPRLMMFELLSDFDHLPPPAIHISIKHVDINAQNIFFSLQSFFGVLVQDPEDEDRCDVIVDDDGWNGKANLIVTCAVPAFFLLAGRRNSVRVELALSTTNPLYFDKLGPTMCLYGCGLQDDDNLVILKEPPGIRLSSSLEPVPISTTSTTSTDRICTVTLNENSQVAYMYVNRESIDVSLPEQRRLFQISPCGLAVHTTNNELVHFKFPYPVNVRSARVYVDEQCQKLFMGAEPCTPLQLGGYHHNPFPMYLDGFHICSLTLPSLNLNQLPKISTATGMEWMPPLHTALFSARERTLIQQNQRGIPIIELKTALVAIMRAFVGQHPRGRTNIFNITTDGEADTLIFVSALRHNVTQSSVLLDAYVVFVDQDPKIVQFVENNSEILNIEVSRGVEIIWKRMLPACVEACRHTWRHTWRHTHKCFYQVDHAAPLSLEHLETPICACGEGKDIADFPKVHRWTMVNNHATRIALMPLSAVPYFEEMFMPWLDENGIPTNDEPKPVEQPSPMQQQQTDDTADVDTYQTSEEEEAFEEQAERALEEKNEQLKKQKAVLEKMAELTENLKPLRDALEANPDEPCLPPDDSTKCSHCKRSAEQMKFCARCKVARYCDLDCQRTAWRKYHRLLCKKME